MFRRRSRDARRATNDPRELNNESSHEHGRAASAEKTLSEGIAEAAASPEGAHLQHGAPDEPGKPEAVDLERDEPVTTARRDG